MRAVGFLLLLASHGCEDPKTQTPEAADKTQVPTPGDGGLPNTQDAAPKATLAAPAGTTRLAEVPGPKAFHFVTTANHIALIDPAPITFASNSDDATDDLATRLGLAKAMRRKVAIFGPADRVKSASKVKARPRGRDVDFDVAGASGDELAEFIGRISGLKVEGQLGGTFAIRVKAMPGNELLAALAALCGATIQFTKGKATIGASKCPDTPVAPPNKPRVEPTYDELGLIVSFPNAKLETIGVAGVVSVGKTPRALLFERNTTGKERGYIVVSKGSVIAAEEDLCASWNAPDTSVSVKTPAEIAEMEAELKRLSDDGATLQEMKAALAKAKAELAEFEEGKKRLRENPPPHPACAGRGGLDVRWRVGAITPRTVKLEPAHGYPDRVGLDRKLELRVAE